jgi:hypothetical protein
MFKILPLAVTFESKVVCPALFFNQERVLMVDPEKDELLVGK